MSKRKHRLKSRLLTWGVALIGICLVLYFMPILHIVPLEETRARSASAGFDAENFVEDFWNEKLLKRVPEAVDANDLLAAFSEDRNKAAERYGHRLGLSGNASYFVSGGGVITAVENGTAEITLEQGGKVAVDTGPVFGNTIRDGSGLLDVSDFPNSQDFNAISSEINQRIESRVFPHLKEKAVVGVKVSFYGGVDLADSQSGVTSLNLVPVLIEFP